MYKWSRATFQRLERCGFLFHFLGSNMSLINLLFFVFFKFLHEGKTNDDLKSPVHHPLGWRRLLRNEDAVFFDDGFGMLLFVNCIHSSVTERLLQLMVRYHLLRETTNSEVSWPFLRS